MPTASVVVTLAGLSRSLSRAIRNVLSAPPPQMRTVAGGLVSSACAMLSTVSSNKVRCTSSDASPPDR